MQTLRALLVSVSVAGLVACNAPSPAALTTAAQAALAITNAIDPSLVAKANASLAQLSAGSLSKACSYFNVAEVYYQNVAGLVPASQAQNAALVISGANSLCSNPPSNVANAIATLGTLYAGIQAAATVK